MLLTLFIWGYITLLCFLYGLAGFALIEKLKFLRGTPPSFVFTCLTGLTIISSLAGLLSIFIPLNWQANLILSAGAVWIAWRHRGSLAKTIVTWFKEVNHSLPLIILLLMVATLCFIWVRAVGEAQNYDTGLYHAQAIRWMEEYSLPPGLGNLHDRLSFNSMWLAVSALFSFAFLGVGSFHVATGWLFALIMLELLNSFCLLMTGEFSVRGVLAVAIIFGLRRLFSLEISSPGTDLPATLLILVVVLLACERIERQEYNRWDLQGAVILILSLLAITIKLNTLPLLILTASWVWPQNKDLSKILAVAAVGLITIIPWLVRNILLSGYLVYPFPGLDVFQVSWKISPADAQNTVEWIRSWARVPGMPKEQVLAMPLAEWLPLWYRSLPNLDRLLLYAGVVSILGIVGFELWRWYKKQCGSLKSWWVIYGTVFSGCLLWFTQAPAMRFGYGFLLLLAGLGPAFGVVLIVRSTKLTRWFATACVLGLLVYQGIGLINSPRFISIGERFLFPLTYPIVQLETYNKDGFLLYLPVESDQCWYAPLPCAPHPQYGLRMYSQNLADGFYIVNPDDADQP